MADRAVFQMAEAAFQDKKVLGQLRERRQDTDLLRNNQLLNDGDCAKEDACREVYL